MPMSVRRQAHLTAEARNGSALALVALQKRELV